MVTNIDILLNATPKYGEILQGVGAVSLQNPETIFNNEEAIAEVKDYLKNCAAKARTLDGTSKSVEFQMIVRKYAACLVKMLISDTYDAGETKINILLLSFFHRVIWPIFIERYFKEVASSQTYIAAQINVKKNVYLRVYGKDDPCKFIGEYKELLRYNRMVLSKAVIKENGDIMTEAIIPIAKYGAIEL